MSGIGGKRGGMLRIVPNFLNILALWVAIIGVSCKELNRIIPQPIAELAGQFRNNMRYYTA
jgi:hypothetical protein